MLYRQSFFLITRIPDEIDQRQSLAIGAGIDLCFVGGNGWRSNCARSADRIAEVCARQVLTNAFEGTEEECLVLAQRSTDRAAKLLAAKILQRFSIGGVCRERFQTLEVKQTSVDFICSRLGNHVDDATGRAAKLCRSSRGNHLKLFDGIQRNVDCRTLAAKLLAEKAIIVITAVEADIIEDATLTSESDFIPVRALDNADAGRQGQQILKFSAQDRSLAYRCFVQR